MIALNVGKRLVTKLEGVVGDERGLSEEEEPASAGCFDGDISRFDGDVSRFDGDVSPELGGALRARPGPLPCAGARTGCPAGAGRLSLAYALSRCCAGELGKLSATTVHRT